MPTEKNIPGTLIPQVPKELFKRKGSDSVFIQKMTGNGQIKIFDHVEYPESGGVFVYHRTFPYPEKGTRDDFMMMSIQFVKRMLINWIRFLVYFLTHFYSPIKVLEKFLTEFLDYANLVDNLGKHYILEKRYYSAQGRELMKGTEVFLTNIGVKPSLADETSHVFTALHDSDTAYYFRLGDILSIANKQRLLENPHKEINFLIKTFAERENRPHLVAKFRMFALLLKWGLWIPRVRRAFKKAVSEMDFSKLGLDEADRYHVRNRGGYNYFGRTLEDRLKEWPYTAHDFIQLQ